MAKFIDGMKTTDITQSTDKFCNERGVYLEFYHIPSKTSVSFKGFITNFVDNYKVDFESQEVYGRLDPIAIYKGTSREIQISWTLVAETEQEAYENLRKAQQYAQMLYPSYKTFKYGRRNTKRFSASTLSTPPLLKMKFMNLAAKYENGSDSLKAEKLDFGAEARSLAPTRLPNIRKEILVKYGNNGDAKEDGLLVIPGNMTIDPKLNDRGALIIDNVAMPYEIEMSSVYTILHEHDLGFDFASQVKKDIKELKESINSAVTRTVNNITVTGDLTTDLNTIDKTDFATAAKQVMRQKKRLSRTKRLLRGLHSRQTNFDKFPYGIEKTK